MQILSYLTVILTKSLAGSDKSIAKIECSLQKPLPVNIAIISAVAFCHLLEPKKRGLDLDLVIASITTLDEIDRILEAKSTIA